MLNMSINCKWTPAVLKEIVDLPYEWTRREKKELIAAVVGIKVTEELSLIQSHGLKTGMVGTYNTYSKYKRKGKVTFLSW